MLRAFRAILRIAQTEPLKSTIGTTETLDVLDHNLHLKSDDELIEIIRERTETLYHPTCTARMAPLDEGELLASCSSDFTINQTCVFPGGVLDPELRVYGVKGLRVVDASAFPTIMAGHTVRLFAMKLCACGLYYAKTDCAMLCHC